MYLFDSQTRREGGRLAVGCPASKICDKKRVTFIHHSEKCKITTETLQCGYDWCHMKNNMRRHNWYNVTGVWASGHGGMSQWPRRYEPREHEPRGYEPVATLNQSADLQTDFHQTRYETYATSWHTSHTLNSLQYVITTWRASEVIVRHGQQDH